ncbi:EAL domain-containing protein [Oxalobacteraceae bacterium R-40]|uniref:EAL domain-containing protein n=1 Tax=Keguizhuia sedimenti TaxID=3064264 RepID=A0ABU1BRV8_9BURK|nr:EAL domain-containing protein [Oxalobacteraceae bacterium R-40]
MAPPKNHVSAFTRNLWLTVASFIILSIAFAAYVHTEKLIDQAHSKRTQSLLLAVEFQQTSEQLTNLARAYVISGTPEYKEKYRELVEIQDGSRPRPASSYQLYEGLALSENQNSRRSQPPSISILALAMQIGVTKEEFSKLRKAKEKLDYLTDIEYTAMELVESADLPFGASHLKAREMLFDKTYLQTKSEVIRPIYEFYRMVDERTLKTVQGQTVIAQRTRMVFVLFGVLLLITLLLTYRKLHAVLGGSVDELHAHIARMGRGDFSIGSLPAKPSRDNSVLAWLVETQKNLAQAERLRKDLETISQRQSSLYKVLGECNEAIMRCSNESELFEQICRSVVTVGGMDMTWIGMPDEEGKRIKPVLSYGEGEAYAREIEVSIDENEATGRGPVAVCFREDRPVWCQDFRNEPAMSPWKIQGEKFGWKANAALPLHSRGKVIAVIGMYSREAYAFDEATRNLLVRLAVDIDYALNSLEDNREREQALEALADSRRMLRTIIDSTPIRIFWKDMNLRFMGCNRAFVLDTKLSSPKEVIGKNDYQMAWRPYAEKYEADDRQVLESGKPRLSYEEPYRDITGQERWLRTSKVPLFDDSGKTIGVLGLYEDITEQKLAAERIHYLANYDTLTGLPGRNLLNERLDVELEIAQRENESFALMFLDLDNFKDINDVLGHNLGDTVLIELARRLRSAVSEGVTIARFGGDEFVLLLPKTDPRSAGLAAQKLLAAVSEPYRTDRYSLSLAASIGIAIYPQDGTDCESLFKSADTAMYYAKKEGRRGFCFSNPAMQEQSARNLQLVSAMNDALEHDQFQVHFQPQISMQDGHVVGVEALLRWQHPEFGFISPGEFMPVAEESGLILSIGEKVLRSAVRQARSWMSEDFGPLTVGVNLSVVQFRDPHLPELVSRILKEEGLPPEYLDLELTESVAMSNPQSGIDMMQQFHERGVQISIDDFGTGYSSLSYLKKFKLHKLKIDQSFVRDITTDPEDKAIVGAIIQMAKRLGLRTIAEGVETSEQMEYLREQGCDEVQGYYCSKPLSSEQFQIFAKGYEAEAFVLPAQRMAASWPAERSGVA